MPNGKAKSTWNKNNCLYFCNDLGIKINFTKDLHVQEYYRWPEEMFEEMDSTLAVQQYIQQLIRKDFTAIDEILKAPDSQDEGVWKYEHLR